MNTILLLISLALQSQLDASGWTVLTPSPESRQVYVSSSVGVDTNDGLSEATPKKTVSAGLKLLRNQQPDWLRLKCGDTFPAEGSWRIETNGGPSADRMTVITSYGTGQRPVLLNGKMWYGSTTIPLKHFAVVGIDQYASFRDPSSPDFGTGASASAAFQILLGGFASANSENWLFENNRWRGFLSNVQIDGRQGSTDLTSIRGITFRRNVIQDAEEFGLQLYYSQNAVIDENVLVKNGWAKRTPQLHNMYMSGAISPTIRNNIFSHGGNMSIKLSGNSQSAVTDFVIENNLLNRGMVGMGHASLNGSWNPQTQYTHERGVIRNNVMMKVGKNLPWNSTSVQAMGFNIGNLNDALFEANIFAHNDEHLAEGQIFRFADPSTERSANITARNNVVWNWLSTQFNASGTYFSYKESVTNLVEENNLPTDVTYTEPSRNLGTYNATLGGAATEDVFLARVTQMQKGDWDIRYTAAAFNNYMRAGFTVATTPDPDPDPTPDPDPAPTQPTAIDKILSGLRAAAAAFLEASE